jgi:hypothetical protein
MTRTSTDLPRIAGTRTIDLTGQQFGRLTPLRHAGGGLWECLCRCGKRTTKRGDAMRTGHVRSCGCLAAEAQWRWVQTRRLAFIEQLRSEGWTITPPTKRVAMTDVEALAGDRTDG